MEILENLDPYWKPFGTLPSGKFDFCGANIMTFMGADATDGIKPISMATLMEPTPFSTFFAANLINFLLGFTGPAFRFTDLSTALPVILAAVGVGIVFVLLFFVIIRQVQKLAEDNSFKIAIPS